MNTNINILYRTSRIGYNKVKPSYVNNVNCFLNAIKTFGKNANWKVISDNASEEELDLINKYVQDSNIYKVSVGHGAGTFNIALNLALQMEDSEIVYFLENDYLHTNGAHQKLIEAFFIGADYISLYDHPDKYYPHSEAEPTRVFLSDSSHWKLSNSTTMTFAAKVKTLKEDERILRKWTVGNHPHDFEMFEELRDKGRSLITPIPGCSTHGETQWLSPLINWEKYADSDA